MECENDIFCIGLIHVIYDLIHQVIRKYALEVQLGNMSTMWPWYRNSFHTEPKGSDGELHNEFMVKFDLQANFELDEIRECLEQSYELCGGSQDEVLHAFRKQRKFMAEMLSDI